MWPPREEPGLEEVECNPSASQVIKEFVSRFPKGSTVRVRSEGTRMTDMLSRPGSVLAQNPRFPLATLAPGCSELAKVASAFPLNRWDVRRRLGRRPSDVTDNTARQDK